MLEQFAARRAAGENPATIEASAQTATGFRYMKAIPMAAEPCGQCHGTNVAPEVAAKIAALYPQDRATGFVPGEAARRGFDHLAGAALSRLARGPVSRIARHAAQQGNRVKQARPGALPLDPAT